jgi:hypothetical protein
VLTNNVILEFFPQCALRVFIVLMAVTQNALVKMTAYQAEHIARIRSFTFTPTPRGNTV